MTSKYYFTDNMCEIITVLIDRGIESVGLVLISLKMNIVIK